MGLDTTHDCYHGSYSGFHNFRVDVAKAAGIELDEMEGFTDDGPGRPWSDLKPDHIHILLNHSDCDGEIPVGVQIALADRLDELVPLVSECWRGHVALFSAGLREANARGEDVRFH